MPVINAQTVDSVNAQTGNTCRDNRHMPKTAIHQASAFWKRLEEALAERKEWHPVNANHVATRLKMSQGSVYRWYRGVGLPELETALYLAKESGVCVDWLLNNVRPKYPIAKDPVLRELMQMCEELTEEGRERVLRAARGELLQQQGEAQRDAPVRVGDTYRRER
jgi:hypothetical protein